MPNEIFADVEDSSRAGKAALVLERPDGNRIPERLHV